MSEGQNSTPTLTQRREPTAQDVEILHQIIIRAQTEPYATERDSLISAYQSVFKERGIDPSQDEVCLYVLFDIMNPDVPGATLMDKFEHVLRSRQIEIVFDEDDASSRDTAPIVTTNEMGDQQQQVSTTNSTVSDLSSQDIADLANVGGQRQSLDGGFNFGAETSYIQQLERKAEQHDRRILLKQTIRLLYDGVPLRDLPAMEFRADQIYDAKLEFKTFTHWRAGQQEILENRAKAESFFSRHNETPVLYQILDSARVQRIRAMEEERLRGWGLYKMTVASREMTFRRQTDARLRTKYLRLMADSVRALSARNREMTDRMSQFQSLFDSKRIKSTMQTMVHSSQKLHPQKALADGQYKHTIGERAVQKWYWEAHQIRDCETVAENQHLKSLGQKFLSHMQNSAQQRVDLEKRYFLKWREFCMARKTQRLNKLYKAFRRKFKEALAGRCLQRLGDQHRINRQSRQRADEFCNANANGFAHQIVISWYNRAHETKRNEEQAKDFSEKRRIEKGMSVLIEKHHQLGLMKQTADDYVINIQGQRVATNCLRSISRKAFEVRRREQDALDHRARHVRQRDRQILRSNLDQLRRQLAETRGEGPLVLPPATPAQRRAEQLNRLASTTPLFAPRMSFAARLREGVTPTEENNWDDR